LAARLEIMGKSSSAPWFRGTQRASDPSLNNPLHQYARWGEPLLFGFPYDSARESMQQEGLGVLSDTQGLEYICIAEVLNKR